jgi:hypothetical protein
MIFIFVNLRNVSISVSRPSFTYKSVLGLRKNFPEYVFTSKHTDKKEKKIFLIYKEIQNGAVAKSYMRKGFLIYEEMRKYVTTYEEAVNHI